MSSFLQSDNVENLRKLQLRVDSENDKLAVQSPPLGEPQGDGTAMQPPPLETPDVIYQDVPK